MLQCRLAAAVDGYSQVAYSLYQASDSAHASANKMEHAKVMRWTGFDGEAISSMKKGVGVQKEIPLIAENLKENDHHIEISKFS